MPASSERGNRPTYLNIIYYLTSEPVTTRDPPTQATNSCNRHLKIPFPDEKSDIPVKPNSVFEFS